MKKVLLSGALSYVCLILVSVFVLDVSPTTPLEKKHGKTNQMIFLLNLFNHRSLKLLKNLGGNTSTPTSDITNMLVLGDKCEIIPFLKDKNQRNKEY